MMKEKLKYLVINTSDENLLEISLYDNGKILNETFDENRAHLKFLIPGIKKILENNSLKLNDLDFISINEGPGSWTGLRIGFATIKVLALVNKLKVIVFNNFELFLNENLVSNALLLIKASNNKYYFKKLTEGKGEEGIIDSENIKENLTDHQILYLSDKFSPHKLIQNKFEKSNFADIYEMEPYYISEGLIEVKNKNEK